MATRAEMRVNTHKALVQSAIDLFSSEGYASTSVDQIVARVGLTKGAFYHHFSGKEELLVHIQHQALDEVLERSRESIARNSSPREQLREAVVIQLDVMHSYGGAIVGRLSNQQIVSLKDREAIRLKRREVEDVVVDIVERGQKDGTFGTSGDARLIVFGILGMCYWSQVWNRPASRWSAEEIAREFGNLALRGVQAVDTPS